MNNMQYDPVRMYEMDQFLKYIYTIGIQNPDLELTSSIIYRELCKYGLDDSEIEEGKLKSNKEMFQQWINWNEMEGSHVKGLRVEHYIKMIQFLQFYSKNGQDEIDNSDYFIKLYIPMKNKNLFSNVKQLFDFITDNHIVHASKVADCMRSDNVIVRLRKSDTESAKRIIEFVHTHFSDSLNKTNPFIPTINGVGVMVESGISYNTEMSILFANYIIQCLKVKKEPSINEFYSWFKENNREEEVNDVFDEAMHKSNSTIRHLDKKEELEASKDEKEVLFNKAITATYQKYGIEQVVDAIDNLLYSNNYNYFTNGEEKYREQLKLSVTKEDVHGYIKKELNIKSMVIDPSIIRLYCYKLFSKSLLKNIVNPCLVTASKYGEEQLKMALEFALKNNNYKLFTRFSSDPEDQNNNRDIISKFTSEDLYNIMSLSLGLSIDEYNYGDYDDLIDMFVDRYIKSNSKTK